ncbi:hypothetical protein HLK59_16650 [Streptomyces sp. S3(2020)]|uniref:hypothetical protein n=1 Tax=Streptomyces sp. S3(2020) TaxID=2732044 RepID=UPI0014898E72|nr:hypothetical protein [Streptomyces sp. S3(2020)]NNN31965.1 hypothetical protein [Streptomyces sp. S3(2020)]
MGRRTVRWRGVCAAVVGTALAALLPGQTALAASTPSPSYEFAPDARPVTGAATTADAESLDTGETYRSTLPASGRLYYRLVLDETSETYVSVTAVPRAGTTVSTAGGIRVYLEDADSRSCSVESAYFGASRSPRPIVAWGARETFSKRTSCKGAGLYYVRVERLDGTDASPDEWELELAAVSESRLDRAEATSAPQDWNSEPPQPPSTQAVRRPGGAGFDEAVSVEQGVWSADVVPGQTLFYKVPVDWGQQLHVTAELGGTTRGRYVGSALITSLYNPARVPVDDMGIGYNGDRKTDSLDPLPPVDYADRYGTSRQIRAMRFAGSYYLTLHLSSAMAEKYGDQPFGVTLRVRVDGTTEAAPAYAAPSVPRGLFEVSAQDREAAAEGGGAADDAVMKAVAVVGIGGGSLVLVVLGVWTVVARRRAAGAVGIGTG